LYSSKLYDVCYTTIIKLILTELSTGVLKLWAVDCGDFHKKAWGAGEHFASMLMQ
jgi:hypothetical protein